MSYIKDLQESHDSLKGLALSLLLIPFWMVTMFFLNNAFYNKTDFTVLCMISGVLSFFSTTLTTLIVGMITESKNGKAQELLDSFLAAVLMLIPWKCLLLFIVYSIKYLFDIHLALYYYIIIYLTPIIVVFILCLFSDNKKSSK